MIEKKNDTMIYRLKGLIHAIEFFSQRFDAEQITHHVVDFIDELIVLDQVVVFAKDDHVYRPVRQSGYHNYNYNFEVNPIYEDIVVLHAGLFSREDIKRFLPKEVSEYFPCAFGIPLIMDKKMFGFVLINRSEDKEPFDSEDEIIAVALMNLFYIALTNFESYDALIKTKKRLDEKIFNLFAIHQSSKILMSTLEIEAMCDLSTSVFSELTQSSITSIFLLNENSKAFEMMAYQNVYELRGELKILLYTNDNIEALSEKEYFCLENSEDQESIHTIFYNVDEMLKALKPIYIVPIVKNEDVLGFITLGRRVNDMSYNDSNMELIHSLASSLYISITNAIYVKTIHEQKKIIDSKLNRLMNMNLMIKNINSSSDLNHLFEITKATLEWSHNVTSGILAVFDQERDVFIIKERIGCQSLEETQDFTAVATTLKKGHMVVASSIYEVEDLLSLEVVNQIEGEFGGALLVPVYLDKFELELLGFIGIFDMKDMLLTDLENQLIYESIANAIAPSWYHLRQLEKIKNTYEVNSEVLFMEKLSEEIEDCREYDLELHVFLIDFRGKHFMEKSDLFQEFTQYFDKAYKIDNRHLVILSPREEDAVYIQENLDQRHSMKWLKYGEDFKDYGSFLEVLEGL
jgi:GAF domain-containing protein